jgi:RNA polymerase sigma factor (sigma-70 family)
MSVLLHREAETDREDLRAFLGGDSQAFERIYARHHAALVALSRRYIPDLDLDLDVVQQAFCSSLPHLRHIAATGNLAAWLRRTTINLAIDELRRNARAARMFSPSLDGTLTARAVAVDSDPRRNPEDALERSQRRDAVLAATARMPDRLRIALVLREMHGLSHVDVSRRLGISRTASEALICRARARFKREYLSVSGDSARRTAPPRATWSPPRDISARQELRHAG